MVELLQRVGKFHQSGTMTIEHPDDDEWGAEALPGGLAEIQRALQSAKSAAARPQSLAEHNDSEALRFQFPRQAQNRGGHAG